MSKRAIRHFLAWSGAVQALYMLVDAKARCTLVPCYRCPSGAGTLYVVSMASIKSPASYRMDRHTRLQVLYQQSPFLDFGFGVGLQSLRNEIAGHVLR